ncbi:Thioesterase-like superfamily protein [Mycolicibacterium rutilum]|uniref:Thioesterase-like superfamily protein n=1 Tax=Mycolicibacterium rutilum TaxID=370526 RepID=A0A1H6KV89_MYCRU|nr:acyl-CoA thioesterase domain-containing protein [Mycolicibacterium rutilum]SEH76848.1 Thioesterase-like superfamily protein [Mycolicibacterium rutilum]
MSSEPSYFTPADGGFQPTQFALSHWGEDHLNGPAVVGLAARTLEKHYGSDEFMPARLTVDLFRAARRTLTTVEVRVVRDGRRVRAAECDVLQDGRAVAQATFVQYRRSEAPRGQEWTPPTAVPELPERDDALMPYIGSEDGGWTRSPAAHQNASRKRFYFSCADIVAGEKVSPFARAVTVAESTSLVTNLGTEGIGYINGDLTVALSRLPVDDWILVQADSHWAADGVAVGTATLFDPKGPFGSGMVTAVANPAAQIDFTNRPFPRSETNYE